ncbi:MAG TPA: SPOR domain-containing protein [Pyrinomonadaceae bacterium]|nr:SPOR domain-containing protein [Pyrinomonadaceae bacterium]
MSYEFALDKKSIISVIAGWIVIGALLFLAGWIVGRQWTTSEAASTPSAATDEQRAELPSEPLLSDEAPARAFIAPRKINPPPVKGNVTPPAAPNASLPQAVETAAAAAAPPPNDGKVVIISEAETDDANKQASAESEYVTVQVGVFLNEKDASHLLKKIESKGYAPTFFSGRDAEARQWYAVRIGIYSDREQATKAAANFTKQEGLKAVVRPIESL